MEKNKITAMSVFGNADFGEVRVVMSKDDEPLFCLADVSRVLELVPSKVAQRLEKGVLSKYPILTDGGIQQANFINEDGLYDVILDSRKPSARKFRKWVTSEVLPSIRRTGRYDVREATIEKADLSEEAKIQLMILEQTARICNFSESARLGMMHKFATMHNIQTCLPNYVTSKGILRSATELLNKNGVKMSAKAFNTLLENGGFITTMNRKGSNGNEHKFRNITERGLEFGENQVSPQSPNQTQPMWYEDKFGELCGLLGIAV